MLFLPQKQIEIFHLTFLSFLGTHLDKKLYAIKGGCNLRFFLKSIRYSEDLDIDARTVAKETLEKKINKILKSNSFIKTIQAKELEMIQITAPKQTETTQRWKIQIKNLNSAIPLPTKIEFSRRNFGKDLLFEKVDPEILTSYSLYPIILSHYGIKEALLQKFQALLSRQETQARDVFDIYHLLEHSAEKIIIPKKNIKELISNLHGVEFEQFKSQVVAYLMTEYQEYYNSEKKWTEIRSTVLKTIKEGST